MPLLITGVSHKTLPIEFRERVYFKPEQCANILADLKKLDGVTECMILSTCNRTEIYIVSAKQDISTNIQKLICKASNIDHQQIANSWYLHQNEAAITHLFRVTSSLDSLVLGETQIFGQVKTAYKLAHQNECTDKILNQLMHQAFAVTKKIRTETGIGLGSTSVSSIAVELLEESICTRNLPTVVVLGAGEIGKTTAKTFLERELGQLVLINRTHDSAKQIAKNVNVSIAKWSELDHWLLKADALITCCSSTKPVITAEQIKKIMQTRHDHRLNIVDLGIPRNVEPHTATLDKVELYNIDDLQNIAQRNHAARKNESKLAEDIIAQETTYTQREIFNPTAGPTIAELNKKCETIRAREVKKMLEQMEGISTEQQMLIERCTTSIINKVLHDPINSLRQNTDELCQSQVINLVRQTFQLETEKD